VCRCLDGKHGAGSSTNHGLGYTPEQDMTQASAPVCPHNNQVDCLVACHLHDLLGRLAHRDFRGRRFRICEMAADQVG
jgi:hypothetical protein